ncbi:hypothetical protein [Amycolatopsis sp. cmx-8-4]
MGPRPRLGLTAVLPSRAELTGPDPVRVAAARRRLDELVADHASASR